MSIMGKFNKLLDGEFGPIERQMAEKSARKAASVTEQISKTVGQPIRVDSAQQSVPGHQMIAAANQAAPHPRLMATLGTWLATKPRHELARQTVWVAGYLFLLMVELRNLLLLGESDTLNDIRKDWWRPHDGTPPHSVSLWWSALFGGDNRVIGPPPDVISLWWHGLFSVTLPWTLIIGGVALALFVVATAVYMNGKMLVMFVWHVFYLLCGTMLMFVGSLIVYMVIFHSFNLAMLMPAAAAAEFKEIGEWGREAGMLLTAVWTLCAICIPLYIPGRAMEEYFERMSEFEPEVILPPARYAPPPEPEPEPPLENNLLN